MKGSARLLGGGDCERTCCLEGGGQRRAGLGRGGLHQDEMPEDLPCCQTRIGTFFGRPLEVGISPVDPIADIGCRRCDNACRWPDQPHGNDRDKRKPHKESEALPPSSNPAIVRSHGPPLHPPVATIVLDARHAIVGANPAKVQFVRVARMLEQNRVPDHAAFRLIDWGSRSQRTPICGPFDRPGDRWPIGSGGRFRNLRPARPG